jgi:hypothetical protein
MPYVLKNKRKLSRETNEALNYPQISSGNIGSVRNMHTRSKGSDMSASAEAWLQAVSPPDVGTMPW